MIYPENTKKDIWDIFITILLIMTCIITPVNIAFSHEWDVYNAIVDGLFLLDVILIFNTAFYDEDLILI